MGAAHLSTQTTIPFTLPGRYWWPEHLALARQSDPLVSLEGHWQIWSSEEKMKELWKKTTKIANIPNKQVKSNEPYYKMDNLEHFHLEFYTIDFWRQKIFSAKTRPWFSWPIPGPGFGSCTRAGIEGWQLGHSTHPRVSQRFWHFWTYIDVNIQGWEVPVLMTMIVWLAMTILYIYVHMYDYDNWKMHHSCVMLHSHDSHVMSWSFPVRKSCRYLSAQWLVVRFTLRRFAVPG